MASREGEGAALGGGGGGRRCGSGVGPGGSGGRGGAGGRHGRRLPLRAQPKVAGQEALEVVHGNRNSAQITGSDSRAHPPPTPPPPPAAEAKSEYARGGGVDLGERKRRRIGDGDETATDLGNEGERSLAAAAVARSPETPPERSPETGGERERR